MSYESEIRKRIAQQVRNNCTPSSEAYAAGGDSLIYAVADWIENPPDWVTKVEVRDTYTDDSGRSFSVGDTVRSWWSTRIRGTVTRIFRETRGRGRWQVEIDFDSAARSGRKKDYASDYFRIREH